MEIHIVLLYTGIHTCVCVYLSTTSNSRDVECPN